MTKRETQDLCNEFHPALPTKLPPDPRGGWDDDHRTPQNNWKGRRSHQWHDPVTPGRNPRAYAQAMARRDHSHLHYNRHAKLTPAEVRRRHKAYVQACHRQGIRPAQLAAWIPSTFRWEYILRRLWDNGMVFDVFQQDGRLLYHPLDEPEAWRWCVPH